MHIVNFWQTVSAKGKPVDMVEYAASMAESVLATTVSRVEDLRPKGPDVDDEHVLWRWEKFLGPAYEAWKKGEALPENGTPVAACFTPDQATALKLAGVSSVEDAASMNDTTMSKVRLPNVAMLKMQAQQFLDAQGTKDFAAALQHKDAEMAELREMMAEQAAQIAELTKPKGKPRGAGQ